MNKAWLVSEEVGAALASGTPVVALESTIVTHGFPYPSNLECAREAERVVREEGAVPATVGIVEGVLKVGLSAEQIERFARAGTDIPKASRRDLPILSARGSDGATTVAATMIASARAGIEVFATGGIGGVHRDGAQTFDISADLQELANTAVTVVCSGAKSILDLGLTLEYLETYGVPVIGYGTDEFPAFYTPTSGLPLPARADTPEEVAAIITAKRALAMSGGVVVANPIPDDAALDARELEAIIAAALAAADARGISGAGVTPFLLARIHAATGGASEEANKSLVYENARLAARIANAL